MLIPACLSIVLISVCLSIVLIPVCLSIVLIPVCLSIVLIPVCLSIVLIPCVSCSVTALLAVFLSGSISVPSVCVSSAGITLDEFLLKLEEEAFDRVLQVNLKGSVLLTQAVSRALVASGSSKGVIINVGSIVGKVRNKPEAGTRERPTEQQGPERERNRAAGTRERDPQSCRDQRKRETEQQGPERERHRHRAAGIRERHRTPGTRERETQHQGPEREGEKHRTAGPKRDIERNTEQQDRRERETQSSRTGERETQNSRTRERETQSSRT
ncbi:UNVERIFIED_CONTAM: hypothetical protein FKN15_009017 [Acipenser sinensis]